MNRLIPALLLTLAALLATLRPAAAQTTPSFRITDLPMLPNVQASRANAINNAGQVVGDTLSSKDKSYRAWIWTPASANAAARIDALAAISSSFARSHAFNLNDAGYVVGRCIDSNSNKRATLWLPGQLSSPVDLNVAAASLLPGSLLSEAIALTNPDVNGVYLVVGRGDYHNPATGTVTTSAGMVWKMQGRNMLSATLLRYPDADPASPRTNPKDINNLGQVSGEYTPHLFSTPSYGCVWNGLDGSVTGLDSLGSQNTSLINDAGTLLGEGRTSGSSRAYVSFAPYTTVDTLFTLLAGSDGQSQTMPYGVNNRNQIVGKVIYASTAVRAACFWQLQVDANGQPLRDAMGTLQYNFYDLNKCSITGTSVAKRLFDARGINDSGWIIGIGTTSSSERPYLLTPQ